MFLLKTKVFFQSAWLCINFCSSGPGGKFCSTRFKRKKRKSNASLIRGRDKNEQKQLPQVHRERCKRWHELGWGVGIWNKELKTELHFPPGNTQTTLSALHKFYHCCCEWEAHKSPWEWSWHLEKAKWAECVSVSSSSSTRPGQDGGGMDQKLGLLCNNFSKTSPCQQGQQHSPILDFVGDLMPYLLCKGRALPALLLISNREQGLQQLWHLRHEGLDRIQVGSSQATKTCWKNKIFIHEKNYSLEKGEKTQSWSKTFYKNF